MDELPTTAEPPATVAKAGTADGSEEAAPIFSWQPMAGPVAPVQEAYTSAPMGERVLAYLLDGYLAWLGAAVIAIPVFLVVGGEIAEDDLSVVASGLVGVVAFAYFVLSWISPWQATPAMRFYGLRVERMTGAGALDPLPAIARGIVLGLPLSLLGASPDVAGLQPFVTVTWSIVLLVSAGVHDEHRGFHDRIAGSIVMGPVQGRGVARAVIGIVALVCLIGLQVALASL